jgi:hypothetical protein
VTAFEPADPAPVMQVIFEVDCSHGERHTTDPSVISNVPATKLPPVFTHESGITITIRYTTAPLTVRIVPPRIDPETGVTDVM